MPRRKPDSVEVVRIELGPWEREHLAPVMTAQAAKPFLKFLGDIMRDVSAILLIAGILTLALPAWLPANWRETIGISEDPAGLRAFVEDAFEIQNIVGFVGGAWAGFWAAGWSGLFTGGIGTVVATILGGLTGWTAVELAEDVVEGVEQAQIEAEIAAAQEAAEGREAAEISWTIALIRTILVLEAVGHRDGPL